MSHIYNFFPLSIYRAKIKLSEKNKKEMVEEIRKMKKDSNKDLKPNQNAWTGDTHGYEYLYKNEKFKLFHEEVEKHIVKYMDHLRNNLIYVKGPWGEPWDKYILITIGPKHLMDQFLSETDNFIKNSNA